MSNEKELGDKGEELASAFLLKKGYKIIKRKYVSGHSEVDLVASIEGKIIFVEVKTRASAYLSDPSLLVTRKKQKQVIMAADRFMKEFHPEKESRFDIVIIITNKEYTSVDHIEDAFYPMI